MTPTQLSDILEKNGLTDGINALLADSSNTGMKRKIRTLSSNMEIVLYLHKEADETLAYFHYQGECLECTPGSGRYQNTGPLQSIALEDMGLSLILKDADHHYILNLEKPLVTA